MRSLLSPPGVTGTFSTGGPAAAAPAVGVMGGRERGLLALSASGVGVRGHVVVSGGPGIRFYARERGAAGAVLGPWAVARGSSRGF